MKITLLVTAIFVLCLTNALGQGKLLTTDPLTNLPLIAATDSGNHIPGMTVAYNEPTEMPAYQICSSKFQGNFYSLYKIKVDEAVAWYASHLSGYKKFAGYDSKRSQTTFYNSDRTIVVVITGTPGAQGENTNAYSVSYQRYTPGLSEKTITSITSRQVVCQ